MTHWIQDPPVAEPAAPARVPARLSVAVMAHPSRARMVDQLVANLDREPTVVWDERNDRWHTGRRSQLAFDPTATHHLVVQDDAIVCRDLVAGMENAINHAPTGVAFSLYVGKVRPYSTRISRAVELAKGCNWIVMRDLHWGVGVVLPTPIIPELIRAQDKRINIAEYDRRMSRWLILNNIPVWYTWPSLVDHQDAPSLVAHGEGRRAHRFLGADVSALTLDWAGAAVNVPDPRAAGQIQFPRRLSSRRPQVERRA